MATGKEQNIAKIIEEAKRNCSGLAKRIKFVMSHESGKVEVVGMDDDFMYMKYHRAKLPEDEQRFFICHRDDEARWLDDLRVVSSGASGNGNGNGRL